VGIGGAARGAASVVLAVAAATGAGCASGRSDGGTTAHAAAPAGPGQAAAALTQVLTFQAFDDRGLLPGRVRAGSVSGSCTGGSLTMPGRADAWRCTGAGVVLDPCLSTEAGGDLACVADPFSTEVTMLQLSSGLPRGNRNDPGQPPWFLQLQDGSRCGPMTAVPASPNDPVPTDRRPRYPCAGGGVVVGDPDRSRATWTVQVSPPGSPSDLHAADVEIAWY
jgi:hypothetical protein